MGLFDTVKLKANALAADAERAGKVTAAQARTVVLQNDIRKAERELGHSAFTLLENDEIAHPDLEAASARLREARQALNDKEEEIAGLRDHSTAAAESTAPAPTDQMAADFPDPIADAAPVPTAEAPVAEAPPMPETPAPVEGAEAAVVKPAAKPRARAAKKPAAKKPTVAKAAKKAATLTQDAGPDA